MTFTNSQLDANDFSFNEDRTNSSNNLNDNDPLKIINLTLNDTYKIIEFIGAGGMCLVYKGKQELLNKTVAIKILLPQLMSNKDIFRRFQQEGKTSASLSHPNIINIYNLNIASQGFPYLVLDFVEGKSLSQILKEEKYLKTDRALNLFKQIASALNHAHENNVVHRDLKPSNILIMITDDGSELVKLADFGIAKILVNQDEESMKLTKTGEIFGSPLYMSPEQCRGDKLDGRSDIYSFGCLMYETLTGRTPYKVNNLVESMYAHLNEFPQRLEIANPKIKIPDKLEALIMKCLAKEPSMRYSDAKTIFKELNEIKESQNDFLGFFTKIINEIKIHYFRRLKFSLRENIFLYILIFTITSVLAVLIFTNYQASKIMDKSQINWNFDLNKYFPTNEIKQSKLSETSITEQKNFMRSFLAPSNVNDPQKYDINGGYYNPVIAFQELTSSAQRLLEEGKYRQAGNIYKDAIILANKIHGKDAAPTVQCHLHYAFCLDQLNEFAKAREEYQKLIEGMKITATKRRRDIILTQSLIDLANMNGREATLLINEIKDNNANDNAKIIKIVKDFSSAAQIYSGLPGKTDQELDELNDYILQEAICYSEAADYYLKLSQPKQSIQDYLLAYHAWTNLVSDEASYNQYICLYKLAYAYYLNNDIDNATETLNKLLVILQEKNGNADLQKIRTASLSLNIKILEKNNQWLEVALKKIQMLFLNTNKQ